MKNILLADDHAVIRAGLKIFIEYCIPYSIIDEVGDGDSAFEKIKQKDYQLIILDVNMPGIDSFELISNIIAFKPDANILIFSMNAESIYAKRSLQLGAKGYVSKSTSNDEIKIAIDKVINAERYISPSLRKSLGIDLLTNNSGNPFDSLSPRETEIVGHLIKGRSLTEICQVLSLHASTVGTFKARIFEKLQCNNVIDINSLAKVYNVIPAVQ